MNTLKAGDKAPQFTLPNQNGEMISLAECLKNGPVLVYFYPKALTPGCTDQACGLRDSKPQLDAKGVTVFGISPDPVAKLKKFDEKHGLNFHLLSDEDHAVADAFGVWGEKKFMGKVYDGIHRLSFIVGTDGIISQDLTKFKTKTHHETVLEALD
ncbi:thioredoxin-dependent thiol peroxidase [Shewanella sp. FJAT-52076]|uniref:thioredoxin-dependent thiol peroxidase n=1 Tax=Shewanella sp. FJAT-52076 TaxID=2864202 RepID=UPI001C656A8E|nr:thioredoxin-dependent thiol peroxidase [Shewanella sp. FJAT-52076]QYJ73718.1 thioredoxin-dependent thiol peroxidase [Shewanella sp. FJAT-52076]